ncbi:unnamed protein product [Cylindrotheca closterium]|uniref:Uncharacterized protein n=1 Tax=Cylindrotheca closterium TaxID=2856 RepID=A0AAD2FUD6_9STRA|nr:unnamed protein product [Cylindrotheca closterium]
MFSLNKIFLFMLSFGILTAASMAIPSPDSMDDCPKCGMRLLTIEKNSHINHLPLERRTKKTGGSGSTPAKIKLPPFNKSKSGTGASKGASKATKKSSGFSKVASKSINSGSVSSKVASKGTKKSSASSKSASSLKSAIQPSTPRPAPRSSPPPPPTPVPSSTPTSRPSAKPSTAPTSRPSTKPSAAPTSRPSAKPSAAPTSRPSAKPSSVPSDIPSAAPSSLPSVKPSSVPSDMPSMVPSDMPSVVPSDMPSMVPSDLPSMAPSSRPSENPSDEPTYATSTTESITAALPDESPRTNTKAIVIVGGSFVLLVLLGSAIALRGSAVEAAVNGGGGAPLAPANADLEEVVLDD